MTETVTADPNLSSDFDCDLAAVNAVRNGYEVSDSNKVLLSFIDKLWAEYSRASSIAEGKIVVTPGAVTTARVDDNVLASYIGDLMAGCTLHLLLTELRDRRAVSPPKATRFQWEAFCNNDDGDGSIGIRIASQCRADEAFAHAEEIAASLNAGPPATKEATRCTCGAHDWPRGTAKIEDSLHRMHYADRACDAVETSPPLPVPSDDLRDYGYAPGNYIGGCLTCHKQMWNVDKRCRTCKECAESRRERAMTAWRASLSEEATR